MTGHPDYVPARPGCVARGAVFAVLFGVLPLGLLGAASWLVQRLWWLSPGWQLALLPIVAPCLAIAVMRLVIGPALVRSIPVRSETTDD